MYQKTDYSSIEPSLLVGILQKPLKEITRIWTFSILACPRSLRDRIKNSVGVFVLAGFGRLAIAVD